MGGAIPLRVSKVKRPAREDAVEPPGRAVVRSSRRRGGPMALSTRASGLAGLATGPPRLYEPLVAGPLAKEKIRAAQAVARRPADMLQERSIVMSKSKSSDAGAKNCNGHRSAVWLASIPSWAEILHESRRWVRLKTDGSSIQELGP